MAAARRLAKRLSAAHRAAAPPAAGRRLAGVGAGGAGRRAGPADGRDQRRSLRACRRPRAAGRARLHPPWPTLDESGHLRRPNGEYYLKGVAELAGAAAGEPARWGRRVAESLGRGVGRRRRSWRAGCQVDLEFEQYRFPGFDVPKGETPFSVSRIGCATTGVRPALPPGQAGRREAAGPRAGGHRAHRPGRVLPDLLGPHAVLPGQRHPGAGPGLGGRFDRRLRAGHHARRSHPPQAAVRALHQRGPDDATRTWISTSPRRAARKSSSTSTKYGPEHTGHGLQLRHVSGALGGARGGLRAGLSAAAGRSGGQGARDLRQRDGPA